MMMATSKQHNLITIKKLDEGKEYRSVEYNGEVVYYNRDGDIRTYKSDLWEHLLVPYSVFS